MFTSVSISKPQAPTNTTPETAGTLAIQQAPSGSIFSTETAGSVAYSTPSASTSAFCAMA